MKLVQGSNALFIILFIFNYNNHLRKKENGAGSIALLLGTSLCF
jgi:hypothetical protein